MRFSNVGQSVKSKKFSLVNCKISGEIWEKFGRIKQDEVIFDDYVYCRQCFSSYKMHDNRGILHFQKLSYLIYSLGRVNCLSTFKSHLQKCSDKNKYIPIIQFSNFTPKNAAVHQRDQGQQFQQNPFMSYKPAALSQSDITVMQDQC